MNGEYRNTVDEKGRLMIPPKIREQLESVTELYLTKSPDKSLWLFSKKDFDDLNSKVNYGPLSLFDKDSRILDMTVIAPAREIELDKTGRLSIPQIFREYAELNPKEECVILGSLTHVEIMSAANHEALMEEYRSKIGSAGDNLAKNRMDK